MNNEMRPDISVNILPSDREIEEKLPHGLIMAFTAVPNWKFSFLRGIGGAGETFIASQVQKLFPNSPVLGTGVAMRKLMDEKFGNGDSLSEGNFKKARNDLTSKQRREFDGQIDSEFSKLIADEVRDNDLVVVASKIFPILASHSEELPGIEDQEALIITVGVMINPLVAIKRMAERQIENGDFEKPTNFLEQMKIFMNVAMQRRERLDGDQEIFSDVYPDISCLNPYKEESVVTYANFILDNSNEVQKGDEREFAKQIIGEIMNEIPELATILLNNYSG